MEKEKCYVDGHGDVHCFIDEEVDCKELQEKPLLDEDYYDSYTTGRGSDA